ncbi:MAG: hypothetical protein JSR98_16350 [Proteobacteria bacterium]|nr:hypothetical protein [Pseudomonadota bacterium]
MFRHLSVAAEDPRSVADFFAELLGGATVALPSCPGGYLALAGDGRAPAVGVYPADSAQVAHDIEPDAPIAVRATIAADKVQALAAARGWGCFDCGDSGRLRTIEVWIEDSWLVEVSAPAAEAHAGFASAAA